MTVTGKMQKYLMRETMERELGAAQNGHSLATMQADSARPDLNQLSQSPTILPCLASASLCRRVITASRDVCNTCGYIAYSNPKVVVGSVVVDAGRVLLCRRAIEPRRGFWTLPAGFLEHGETLEEGAAREAAEEAGARLRFDGVLALYSISRIGQVQVIFRARFDGPPALRGRDRKPRRPPVRLGRNPLGGACLSVRELGAARLARAWRRADRRTRNQPSQLTRGGSTG